MKSETIKRLAAVRDWELVQEHADVPHFPRGRAPLAIIIMGVCGCGKSTVGIELAHALACPFLEGDRFHARESIAKMRAGKALTDDDRWPWLDRLGRAARAEVDHRGIVVGACSALKRIYRDRLRQTIGLPVLFVLLDGEYDELWRRLANREDHFMPASLLASQLDILERLQVDECAVTLDAGLPPSTLRDQIMDRLAGLQQKNLGG